MRTPSSFDRRDFLRTAGAVSIGMLIETSTSSLRAANSLLSGQHYTVQDIKRTTIRVPYREVPERNMDRELPHWRYAEIFEVELASGVTGFGETMLYYTWGVTNDDDVARAYGKNAMQLMWDDSLGAGLQIALFDAVARTSGVPVHCVLGKKVNDKTPLSWWNIDTSADDMESECKTALDLGYRSYKTKGRPWFDIWEQVEKSAAVVPDEFKIDMDFNDTLLTAEKGMHIIKGLEKYPEVDIYETPIPQGDVEGNRKICEQSRVNVAMHFGNPKPEVAVREQCCDGFVIGGGASSVVRAGNFSSHADKPFWLQLVGTGITAAFSLHFGGVLSHATWPAVNCHQLYKYEMLQTPIKLESGFASVPDTIGLGYELDHDAVAKLRVDKPEQRPDPMRMIETSWPSGKKMYTANNGNVNFMLTAGQQGKYPYYVDGADSKLVPNNGSAKWMELYNKSRKEGPIEGELKG